MENMNWAQGEHEGGKLVRKPAKSIQMRKLHGRYVIQMGNDVITEIWAYSLSLLNNTSLFTICHAGERFTTPNSK